VAQDAFSDEDRSTGTEAKARDAPAAAMPAVAAPPNAWKKPPMSNGVSEQPIALPTAPASKRKVGVTAKDPAPRAQQAQQQRKEAQKAEVPRKDKQPAAVAEPKQESAPVQVSATQEVAPSQLPPPPVAPKTPALSWRKILAGTDFYHSLDGHT